ncbi:MAG: 30S ribosome-binding factor RbfA [Oscillospiraceae bacterium]|nr:30S ribosome-binding factor RbfA [Oscillospiraceae bacterium]
MNSRKRDNFARADRVGEEMRSQIDALIRRELSDPRVTGTYSITRVDVTRDFRYAKVRVSVMETELRKPMLDALKSAAGFLRRRLTQDMGLRFTPELLFEIDENIEYGVHIAELLRQVVPAEARQDAQSDDGEPRDE